MNVIIINGQKHLADLRIALLLVVFTLFFSDLSAQNGNTGDTIKVKPIEQKVKEPEIFVVVEDMPEFPGGQAAMAKYIMDSLEYPAVAIENGIQGRVMVQFVVDTNGKVGQVKVLKSMGWGLDEAAIKVVTNMPDWTPGKHRGIPVMVSYVLPIRFELGIAKPSEAPKEKK